MQNSSSFFQGQPRFSNGFYAVYSSPFGVELKGRNLKKNNAKNYRFGFQGQEGDDQIKGDGNSVNFEFRMHDPRLGRFFAVDPLNKEFAYNSPYAFSENIIINAAELEGLEKVFVYNRYTDGKGIVHTKYSHTEVDTRLKENVNRVDCYNKKGVVTAKIYHGLKTKTCVTIKAGTENKNDYTDHFQHDAAKDVPELTMLQKGGAPAKASNWYDHDAMDGQSGNGCMEGEKGMVLFNGIVDKTGKLMKQSQLPVISQVGNGMQIFSLTLSTALDYKNLSKEEATINLVLRLSKRGVDKFNGKLLKKTGQDGPTTELQKIGLSECTRIIRDALIITK
jgi:RHS repeat-associated protein